MAKYLNAATQLISKRLENGEAPWQVPYKAGFTRALPYNVQTGNPYNGINFIVLSMLYEDPRWLSVKQCGKLSQGKNKKIHIKKGAKAEGAAIYWIWDKQVPDIDEATGQVKTDPNTGKELKKTERLKTPVMRETPIFNAAQIEGLPEYEDTVYKKLDPDEMINNIKKIIENCHEEIDPKLPVYDGCFEALKRIVDNLLEDSGYDRTIKELSSDIALYYIAARTGVGFTQSYIDKRAKMKDLYIKELQKNRQLLYLYKAATLAKNNVINPMEQVIKGFDFDQAKIAFRNTKLSKSQTPVVAPETQTPVPAAEKAAPKTTKKQAAKAQTQETPEAATEVKKVSPEVSEPPVAPEEQKPVSNFEKDEDLFIESSDLEDNASKDLTSDMDFDYADFDITDDTSKEGRGSMFDDFADYGELQEKEETGHGMFEDEIEIPF